jgi:hypothetical protein
MKKIIVFILIALISFDAKAQNDNSAGIAAAALGLAALGAGIGAKEKMEEMAELAAAQYLLSQDLEGRNFYLKLLDLDAEKGSSDSYAGITTFTLTVNNTIGGAEFKRDGEKYVMLYLKLSDKINEYGTRVNMNQWLVLNFDNWLDIFSEYVMLASFQKDKENLKTILRTSKLVAEGIKQDKRVVISFFNLNGDTYIAKKYNDQFKIVYNEKSMGFYSIQSGDLVLLGRKDMARIQDFFLSKS